jgi:hypothetical protein
MSLNEGMDVRLIDTGKPQGTSASGNPGVQGVDLSWD